MELKYVRPVPIGQPLTVKGKLLDGDSRLIRVQGDLFDGSRKMLARSLGEFAFLPEDRLSEVPQGLKREMKALFEKMQSAEQNGSNKSSP
jgi:acyl-CoA thioesterase FadM